MVDIDGIKEYYKTKNVLDEFEAIRSMYITNKFAPILKIKKEAINFRLYKFDFFNDDNFGMIESYYNDDDGEVTIKFKETPLMKAIRENYIDELILCCDETISKIENVEIKNIKNVKETTSTENQNKGENDEISRLNKHYKHHSIEPLDIIDDYGLDFYLGNAIKYILRSPYKGSEIDDLLKAKNYIDLKIERHLKKELKK